MSRIVPHTCHTCGKEFHDYAFKKRKYCGTRCAGLSHAKKVQLTCRTCGKVIWLAPSTVAQGRKTCSKACAERKVTVICKGCGKPIVMSAALAAHRTYCSRACRHQTTRVSYTCEQCGKTGQTHQCFSQKRFCSNQCRLQWFSTHFRGTNSPQWLGGKRTYYGPNWREQRRAARIRDNHTCQDCGKGPGQLKRAVAVHHDIPFRLFGVERYEEANALSNLICLCDSCHQKRERREKKASLRATPLT